MKNHTIKKRHGLKHGLKNGGKTLGKGYKGSVYDLCNKDHDSLCKDPLFRNSGLIHQIIFYFFKKEQITHHIETNPEEIQHFVDFVKNSKDKEYIVKEFYSFDKHHDMQNEMENYKRIHTVFRANKDTDILGCEYPGYGKLIGFEIVEQASITMGNRCFVIEKKCQQTLNNKIVQRFTPHEFHMFVTDILKQLVALNKINMAHGDIKLDNIMKCGSHYTLIDWEYSRPLNYKWILEKRYLGSSPLYFKMAYGPAWREMYDTISVFRIFSIHRSDYLFDAEMYYDDLFQKTPDTRILFHRIKNSLDLHALGSVIYNVVETNKDLQKNPNYSLYMDFVHSLYKMKNASVALKTFSKIAL